MNVTNSFIAPGYFSAMTTPLLDGRDFTVRDDGSTEPVIIVNRTFAQRYFGGRNPIGRKVRAFGRSNTIVGLAADSKYFSPAETPLPFFYAPFRQEYRSSTEIAFFIKTNGDPVRAIPTLRRAVSETGLTAGFHAVPLAEYTEVGLFSYKFAANLMAALGAVCLGLAAIGLYSVISYAVSQRAQEIGVRMALGARSIDVIAMVMRQGMLLAGIGLAAGFVAAIALTRIITGMLFRVGAFDPVTFAVAAIFLLSVALIASWIPARRATRQDP